MAFKAHTHFFTTFSAAVLFSSCAQMATSSDQVSAPEIQPTTPVVAEELSGESLFQLLLAEIATNRQQFGAAASLYSEIGENHNDVAVIERAAALNQSIGDYPRMFSLTSRWVELRPDDAAALRAHSLSAIATGQLEIANTSIEHWMTKDPEADVSLLLPGLQNLTADQLTSVAGMLANLQTQHKKSASLYYTRSRIALALNDIDQAMKLANESLAIHDNLQVNLFKFQLLQTVGKLDDAKTLISRLDKKHPENRQVAVQYARFLFRNEPQNLSALEKLHNRFSTEPTISRTYARAAFDAEDYDAAQAVYQHLLELGYSDEAHYFLGRIDLVNAMTDSAINHFESVQQSPFRSSAIAEWVSLARPEDEARIMIAIADSKQTLPEQAPVFWRLEANYFQLTDQNERAWTTLEQALVEFPESVPLLYDQAMIAANEQRNDVMERNLVTILELEPNNINALNALGYSWADTNKNLTLAGDYIDQALAAEPDNPAFQDSKGWHLYRIGKPTAALEWLQKAYSQMENDEVAAHIAEVLWVLDRKAEAKQFLQEIERINPSSRYLDILKALFNE